jgi:hypothetical protein
VSISDGGHFPIPPSAVAAVEGEAFEANPGDPETAINQLIAEAWTGLQCLSMKPEWWR